jgi:gliding motility-associated lipoprotein GldH
MKRKSNFFQVPLVLFLVAALTFSCQSSVVFDEVHELGEKGWHKNQKAVFQVDISDTSQVLDVGMTFLHTDDYPYSNIWLFVDMEGEKGISVKDTLEFFLSETDGRWLGKKKGDFFEVSALYQHAVKLSHPGSYRFEISHGMRRDVLPYVASVEFWMQNAY